MTGGFKLMYTLIINDTILKISFNTWNRAEKYKSLLCSQGFKDVKIKYINKD